MKMKAMQEEGGACFSERKQPLVTVVTATYNLVKGKRCDYFRQCAESVHAQTYGHIEHIVIDGASSDGTLEILREYEDKGWLQVYSEPDTGIYDAFNKGIQHAKGKYIAFLNSDDFWHDSRGVEYSVHALEVAGADFSYAPHRVVEHDGQEMFAATELPVGAFFSWVPFNHQSMLCRTDKLRNSGGFDTSFRIAGDTYSILSLMLKGARCIRVPLCFTSFRNVGISSDDEFYSLMLKEVDEVHIRLFFPYVKEAELAGLRSRWLPDDLKKAFAQLLHPSVYADLERRCTWSSKRGMWRCHIDRLEWGPLGIRQLAFMRYCVRSMGRMCGRFVSLFSSVTRGKEEMK